MLIALVHVLMDALAVLAAQANAKAAVRTDVKNHASTHVKIHATGVPAHARMNVWVRVLDHAQVVVRMNAQASA